MANLAADDTRNESHLQEIGLRRLHSPTSIARATNFLRRRYAITTDLFALIAA
jgi:hypothetical protein